MDALRIGLKEIEIILTEIKATKVIAKLFIYYFTNKIERIYYKAYRNIRAGLVGIGANDLAHSTVVQKRINQ